MSLDDAVRIIGPEHSPFTFGRDETSTRHLHVGPSGSRADTDISRRAGRLVFVGERWMLSNVSTTRPFVVAGGAQEITLTPPGVESGFQKLEVDDHGVVVRLTTRTREYEICLDPVAGESGEDAMSDPGGPLTPPPLSEPSAHDRVLLAAKFLSRPKPGDAIGDARAAPRVNRVRGSSRLVGARAVEGVVRRWKDRLEELGHHDLGGRHQINRIGALLLHYQVLTTRDRLDLPPVDYHDHDEEER